MFREDQPNYFQGYRQDYQNKGLNKKLNFKNLKGGSACIVPRNRWIHN